MIENKVREMIVQTAQSYLGTVEGSSKHLDILDTYNDAISLESVRACYNPLPRRHVMQPKEAWCATFVSAVGLLADAICYPLECSCNLQIEQLKNIGIWVESDDFVPSPGDIIFYDWDDKNDFATTDNKNRADHVGIVERVTNGTITVIEGNKSHAVGRRSLSVNGRYIRGYGALEKCKLFEKVESPDPVIIPWAGVVSTPAGLNVRTGAGVAFKKVGALRQGTVVSIVETVGTWGRIGSGRWVCLDYIERL